MKFDVNQNTERVKLVLLLSMIMLSDTGIVLQSHQTQ